MKQRFPGVWSFVTARFRKEYLGLHLTVGFAVTLGFLWLFLGLTEDVIHAEAITRFDLAAYDWIRAHATVGGYAAFGVITALGSPPALLVIGLTGLLGFLVRHRRAMAIGWSGAFGGGALLDSALKLLVHRPRPPYAFDYLERHTWSYPSGHAMMSVVCFGMVAYAICVLRLRHAPARVVTVLGAAVLIVLVGASRVYLGVHYVSDVMAGFAAGTCWLAAVVSGLEVVRRGTTPRPPHDGTGPPR